MEVIAVIFKAKKASISSIMAASRLYCVSCIVMIVFKATKVCVCWHLDDIQGRNSKPKRPLLSFGSRWLPTVFIGQGVLFMIIFKVTKACVCPHLDHVQGRKRQQLLSTSRPKRPVFQASWLHVVYFEQVVLFIIIIKAFKKATFSLAFGSCSRM